MSQLLQQLAQYTQDFPTRIALQDHTLSLTYAELLPAIEHKAVQLREASCRVLGIALDNSVDWVLWDLATVACGVVCVPLPAFFTAQQRQHVVQSAGIDHLITSQALLATGVTPSPAILARTSKITFTSGTTGTPKGVCLSQQGLEQVAASLVQVIGAEHAGQHLSVLPLAILLENVAGIYSALLAGATCHLYGLATLGMANPFQPDFAQLVGLLKQQRISSAILVPELLRGLLYTLHVSGVKLPDLQFLAVGGSKVDASLLQQAQVLGLPLYEGYGLSECGSVVALNTPAAQRVGAVGKVLPHLQYACVEGEIVIQNPAFLGYLGLPQQGAFATGDLGYVDPDGFLHINGRKKNLLITSFGRNISPEWVESVLLSQPEIAQAIVFGDAQPYLTALLVPSALLHGQTDVNTQHLLNAALLRVNERLPDYAHVQVFHVIPLLNLSDGTLTGTGRSRREVIAQQYTALLHP